jgi:diguanylate cyclase (GGDEF)-like protein
VVISATYCALILSGVLPMSPAWFAASGLSLLLYSVAMFLTHVRWPDKVWIHRDVSPFSDVLVVTLAIIAVAQPAFPIWVGYYLIIMSLSTFHSTRYVVAFAFFSVANMWGAILLADELGRGEMNVQLTLVASVMAVFTAMNCDVISTSTRKLREMVLEASMTDPLTGLQNRRRFREILDSHSGPTRPLAVIMYDVDNFKQINETRGHVHADKVLISIGNELRKCFRDADAVARYGGDELIVLAHVDSTSDAMSMGQRSLDQVRTATGINLSAGVAVYPITTESLDDAVNCADQALGQAKRDGKARVLLSQTLTRAA